MRPTRTRVGAPCCAGPRDAARPLRPHSGSTCMASARLPPAEACRVQPGPGDERPAPQRPGGAGRTRRDPLPPQRGPVRGRAAREPARSRRWSLERHDSHLFTHVEYLRYPKAHWACRDGVYMHWPRAGGAPCRTRARPRGGRRRRARPARTGWAAAPPAAGTCARRRAGSSPAGRRDPLSVCHSTAFSCAGRRGRQAHREWPLASSTTAIRRISRAV
jgi:hypothetical protein